MRWSTNPITSASPVAVVMSNRMRKERPKIRVLIAQEHLTAHPQVGDESFIPALKRKPKELPPADCRLDDTALQPLDKILCRTRVSLQTSRLENLHPIDSRPHKCWLKASSNDLNFGKLRHRWGVTRATSRERPERLRARQLSWSCPYRVRRRCWSDPDHRGRHPR